MERRTPRATTRPRPAGEGALMRRPLLARIILAALLCAAAAGPPPPRVEVHGSAAGCPEVTGRFVVVLDAGRGMLLMSTESFPGARRIERTDDGGLRVAESPGSAWSVQARRTDGAADRLWGNVYPFVEHPANGCVAFDRTRFSSEGDLVTYARWLAEKIFASLPESIRSARPCLELSDRELALRVVRPGYPAYDLDGREGATRAFRFHNETRTYLLLPFVLDQATGTVAVQVATTDTGYFAGKDKHVLGWVVASPAEPATLDDPPMEISVTSIGPR